LEVQVAAFCWLQARGKVLTILRELIAKRRASSATHNDILEKLVRNEDGKYKLDDEEIMEQIITILYSGYETVSTTTMMAIKYLCDNPNFLQAVRVSHSVNFHLIMLFTIKTESWFKFQIFVAG